MYVHFVFFHIYWQQWIDKERFEDFEEIFQHKMNQKEIKNIRVLYLST